MCHFLYKQTIVMYANKSHVTTATLLWFLFRYQILSVRELKHTVNFVIIICNTAVKQSKGLNYSYTLIKNNACIGIKVISTRLLSEELAYTQVKKQPILIR